MLKKILIGAVALVVVLVVAAVALVAFVDVDRFKPQIRQFVADRYQRDLTFDGSLSLSLFPRIAVALPPTTLSEPGGKGEAARLVAARVAVAVMPLLQGRVVADTVTVRGLVARIERRADGSTSIDDLLGRGPAAGAPPVGSKGGSGAAPGAGAGTGASTPGGGASAGGATTAGTGEGPAAGLPAFEIGGLQLTDAQLVFDDRAAGRTVTLDRLALETGRVANAGRTPVKFSSTVTSTAPQLAATLDLKAEADYDLPAARYAVRGVDAKLAGRIDGAPLSVQVTAPQVELAGDRLAAGEIAAAVDWTDPAAGPRRITANLKTPLAGRLDSGTWTLERLAGQLVVEGPGQPGGALRAELTGRVSADTAKEAVRADLAAKADQTNVTAKVSVDGFATPKIGFDIGADRLDLDRWWPAAPAGAATAGTAPGTGATTTAGAPDRAAGAPGQAASPAATATTAATAAGAEAPIDLSALRVLSLNGRVAIGHLAARGIEASDLKLGLNAAGGRLQAKPIAANFYQGRLDAEASVVAGATPAANQVALNANLNNISINPLLVAVAQKDLLEGRGNVRLAVQSGGATVTAMKQRADGTATLALRDGAIKGINLAETIRKARGLLQGGRNESVRSDTTQKTDFTELDVSFRIADGVAKSDDLDAKSPLLRLGGAGQADLVASRLDYTVRVSVVGTSAGQGGRELDELRGVTIPVRLTGPFDALDWQIDWVSAGRDALKSRAAEALRKQLPTEQLEDKAKERLGDALKGLFKR